MALLYEELSYAVIGAAMEVHRQLKSGYLEQVYEGALAHELSLRNIPFKRQRHLPVFYKGIEVGHYVADLVVDDKIIVELKAVSNFNDRHKAQTINYLTTTGYKLALLINFGKRSLEHKRIIH